MAATSSISMPPSDEAITTTRPTPRSTTMAEVELARDVHALLDEQALDQLAARSGLVRDQVHAEDLLRGLARGRRALDHLDAAPLAAAAGVDLRLDDDDSLPVSAMSALAAASASSGLKARRPFGIGTPSFLRISLAWYSWIFTVCPVRASSRLR